MRLYLLWVCIVFVFCFTSPALAQEFDARVSQFLLHQTSPETGLPASFINSDDAALRDQASTYDMALAGLAFLQLKDQNSAKRILTFFDRKWSGSGFCNFYNIKTGACGVEATVHLGPNMWVATLALQYMSQSGDRSFYPLARKIALWGMALNHQGGGVGMGPFRDWGADWPNVFGAESNIVAYSVFRAMAKDEKDVATRVSMEREMQGIRDFLNKVVLVRGSDGRLQNIIVGSNVVQGASMITACDVVSMLLLVFDPEEIKTFFSLDEEALMGFARERFIVDDDGMRGFDFADQSASLAARRPRMISLEWTMQMASALRYVSDVYAASSDVSGVQEKVVRYKNEAAFFVAEVDKKAISLQGMSFYSYATKDSLQVFPFAPWWKTPSGDVTRCGAMASTAWRLFYDKGFNPLRVARL